MKEKITKGNKVSKSKSSEKKLVHMPSDPELEPGKELIMCAKLTIKTPKSYQKDVDKYIRITRYISAILFLVREYGLSLYMPCSTHVNIRVACKF